MIVDDHPSPETQNFLTDRVLSVRPKDHPDVDRYPKKFAVLQKNARGEVEAGAYVYVHPGWAYLDLLWVAEGLRHAGLGHLVMKEVETEALRRGCIGVYLWTQDYEAPGFYEKLGYERFVSFDGFIPGHRRIGFMKRIAT